MAQGTRAAQGSTRADVALVERGVVRSRALAQRLIESGAVEVVSGGLPVPVSRSSQPVDPGDELKVRESPESRFASRAGAKLAPALAQAGIDCAGLRVLDVGMSTGGFTDCVLQAGAAAVVGIEVGHGQLAPRLASDPRVTCFEKTHIRDVTPAWLAARGVASAFDLVVVDLSFISGLGLLAHLAALAAPGAALLMLVKPQFELGPHARDGKGIVRAGADLDGLRDRAFEAAAAAGWEGRHWFASALPGHDGNQEYFLAARRSPVQASPASHPASGR